MSGEAGEAATKLCPFCKQDVPSANFEMHSIHCQRFLTSCPHCKESVNRKELQEHIEENHCQVKCDDCGESVEKLELESHKEADCKQRTTKCPYCEISLPACDMDEHKESCGSRTEECETCRKRVLIKDLERHISSGCQIPVTPLKNNPKPPADWFGFEGFRINERFLDSMNTDPSGNSRQVFGSHVEPDHSDFSVDMARTPAQATIIPEEKQATPISCPVPIKHEASAKFFSEENVSNDASYFAKQDKPSGKSAACKRFENDSKKSFNVQELPPYGIPDSDSDDHSDDEKRPPHVADDIFLPCEFCNVLLPADSLGFHQATCSDETSPTPRPKPLPSNSAGAFADLPFDLSSPSGGRFEGHASASYSPPLSRTDVSAFTEEKEDIGEGSAPCEFCNESFSLGELAVHQISCSENPNMSHFESDPVDPRRNRSVIPPPRSLPPKSHTSKSPSSESLRPKSFPWEIPPPESNRFQSVSSESTVKTPFSLQGEQAKPVSSGGHTNSVSSRGKRPLAPSFSNSSSPVMPPGGARPKTKTNLPGDDKLEREMRKPKRNNRLKTGRPPVNSPPKSFHEVNVLGGGATKPSPAYAVGGGPTRQSSTLAVNSRKLGNGTAGYPFARANPTVAYGGEMLGEGLDRGNRSNYSTSATPSRDRHHQNTRARPNVLFNGDVAGAQGSWHGGNRGSAGARGSYPGFLRGGSTRGRSGGTSTITFQKRASAHRGGFSGSRPNDTHVGSLLDEQSFRLGGVRVNANAHGKSWESGYGGSGGRGQRLGSGPGGSRGKRNRNPRSARGGRPF